MQLHTWFESLSLMIEIIFLILPVVFALSLKKGSDKDLSRYREEAKEQFRAYRAKSSDARFVFNGADAEIVKEEESIIGDEDDDLVVQYSLTCFARNAAGEYFMFVSNQNGKPFFKHVSQSNAKIALGKIYLSPPN